MRELKSTLFHVKAIDGRAVTGIFSVLGNLDDYQDKIWPGAFAKTFAERGSKVLHLWQHDFSNPPIAVIKSLREVTRAELPDSVLAEAPEAMGGAEVVREYLDTPRANEVLAALKAGAPLQMSFAYDAIKYDFEALPDAKYDWEQIRNLREVRVWETSDVLWGANAATVASKTLHLPLDVLVQQLQAALEQVKSGRRNSATDQERINTIAALAIELGADNVKTIDSPRDDDKDAPSRAADTPALTPAAYALKQQQAQRALALLERHLV